MKTSCRLGVGALALLVALLPGGCTPPGSAPPPLSAAAAQRTIDNWNPQYCKVVEFYGFHKPGERGASQLAYVLLTNPADKAHKPLVYTARFQLLTLPDGQQRWYLINLVNHAAGLTRRQGWDNLLVPVKEAAPSAPAPPAAK